MTADELEDLAQQAAERRLAVATSVLFDEEDELAAAELTAPYCGCDTCIVREVVAAAWPYLFRLSNHPDTVPPDLP